MSRTSEQRLSLDGVLTYAVTVPGTIRVEHASWADGLEIVFEYQDPARPVTILTGEFDQAGLQSLLRRLYSMGLPLISVRWVGRS